MLFFLIFLIILLILAYVIGSIAIALKTFKLTDSRFVAFGVFLLGIMSTPLISLLFFLSLKSNFS